MKKYNRVTKEQVFKTIIINCMDIMGIGLTPPMIVRHQLKTSKYQVYKYAKELIEDGLIKRVTFTIPKEHQYEPEDSLPVLCYEITKEGRQTELYKNINSVSSRELDFIMNG